MFNTMFSKMLLVLFLLACGFGAPLMIWQWIKRNMED